MLPGHMPLVVAYMPKALPTLVFKHFSCRARGRGMGSPHCDADAGVNAGTDTGKCGRNNPHKSNCTFPSTNPKENIPFQSTLLCLHLQSPLFIVNKFDVKFHLNETSPPGKKKNS